MGTSNRDKPLVLIVDDVPANLHVLAESLRHHYRVKMATSGAVALDLAHRDDKPQLILLDVMMPGMSGIEVLRALRDNRDTRDIPVVFLTAHMSDQNQLDGLELGAEDYLTKPVSHAVLLARVRNIIERNRVETQLRLAAHVFEHSGEAILITDGTNRIVDVNPAFTRLTGYSLEEVRGKDPGLLASGRTSAEAYQTLWTELQDKGLWQGEIWNRDKSGNVHPLMMTISVVPKRSEGIDFYIASYVDLSQQKASEERIRYIAHHDALTGLPNRLALLASLEQSIALARREKTGLAVMFIDLDRFKGINDSLGHSVGDQLLIEVGKRLFATCRASDLVARLGGDEFVVVLRLGQSETTMAVRTIADKLIAALSHPYALGEHTLHTTPSIGISLFPQDGETVDALMKNADIAMYRAKESGRGRWCGLEFSEVQSLEVQENWIV